MLSDQRTLDHLAFVKANAVRFIAAEFKEQPLYGTGHWY